MHKNISLNKKNQNWWLIMLICSIFFSAFLIIWLLFGDQDVINLNWLVPNKGIL
jgi:hypothetical protein